MTVKEWLNRGRNLDKEIKQLLEDKENALNLACGTSVDYSNERVQTSGGNVSERKFIHYADYSKILDERIDELYTIKTEIKQAINTVDDTILRTLLIARYINMKSWEKIAEDLGYSDKWVRTKLHSQALQAIRIETLK